MASVDSVSRIDGRRRRRSQSDGKQRERGGPLAARVLIWACAAVAGLASAFLVVSRVVLPCCVPVSRNAWSQATQVEVRSPIDATRVEILLDGSANVVRGTKLLRIVNELADGAELRDLIQKGDDLQASLVVTGRQLQAVTGQLREASGEWDALSELARRSLLAEMDRLSAELDSSRAEQHNADGQLRRARTLGSYTAAAEREAVETRLQTAAAHTESLLAQQRRLTVDLEGIQRRCPLTLNVDILLRKKGLELQSAELEAKIKEIQANLAACQKRRRAAQQEHDRKSKITMAAPCSGRVIWRHGSSGSIRANEPLLRIGQSVNLVECLFPRGEADRVLPGQAVLIALATGELLTGKINRLEESSPAAEQPGRVIAIPRIADQVRAIVALDSAPPSLRAGVPGCVAVTEYRAMGFLMTNFHTRWAVASLALSVAALLIVKPVHARIANPQNL